MVGSEHFACIDVSCHLVNREKKIARCEPMTLQKVLGSAIILKPLSFKCDFAQLFQFFRKSIIVRKKWENSYCSEILQFNQH